MKELEINGFRLRINIIQNNYIIANLSEPNSFVSNERDVKDWAHEDMGFQSPTTKYRIKKAIKHWLSRFDNELAEKSGDLVEDFFADHDALKATSDVQVPPASNLN